MVMTAFLVNRLGDKESWNLQSFSGIMKRTELSQIKVGYLLEMLNIKLV